MEILFDRGPSQKSCVFSKPQHILEARAIGDIEPVFRELERARSQGFWIAGFASYELGYALEPTLHALMPQNRVMPLLYFGVYKAPCAHQGSFSAPIEIAPPRFSWNRARYDHAFKILHDHIAQGDIYQANLTMPASVATTGTSDGLYKFLVQTQKVPHGSLIQSAETPDILCRSPELFFATQHDGSIITRPMKGTQPRGDTEAQDQINRLFLAQDDKNRAENLMIVDLLRNDLSRICTAGTVRVPKLFDIETYATVHQMTSLIQGELQPRITLYDIFHALFPCGSITGAPKIRAMQILRDLEEVPREIYCGTIGWAAPDNRAQFNVAIRTLWGMAGKYRFNVGGGIVWDSQSAAEYQEAMWKSRFITQNLLQTT